MQKFLQTSKKIVQRSTVRGIKPIELISKSETVSKASDDFNFLIQKIDDAVSLSVASLQNSTESLEQIEKNIEDLLELIDTMDEQNNLDKELIKKENIMIEALEEVSNSIQKLQIIEKHLEKFKK
jgi:methyl-accepting chemotaxis protein